MKKNDLPAMPFYWGDWFKALDVQMLPRDIRCTWFEILGRMWESKNRGELSINGEPPTIEQLAQLLGFGSDIKECQRHLDYLERFSIYSRKKNGVIYCRKMVHEEDVSCKRSKAGKLGMSSRYDVCYNKKGNKKLTNTEDEYEYENEDENEDENEESLREEKTDVFKKKQPNVEFVELFAAKYRVVTGSPYKTDRKDFIIAARLIKTYGIDALNAKVDILAVYCSGKVDAWFAKNGWSDFTIGNLSRNWNSILPKLNEEQKRELKRQEESQKQQEHERKINELLKTKTK